MGLFGRRKETPPSGRPELGLPRERLVALFQALVRTDPDRPCPWCNQSVGPAKEFCNFCGRPVCHPLCPSCGTPALMGVHFCKRCGRTYDPAEAMRAALRRLPEGPT